jgi:surfactin synthase thioesterase subunit
VVTQIPDGYDVQATQPGGWFVRVEHREGARARLYALPHAGAGPGALGALAAELPHTIELWALNLPGRQARLAESPRTELEPLIGEIAADLAETPGYYSLFGYCGGALLAYLAARQSRPKHLFVGSFAAPDLALVPRRLHILPGDLFWDVVLAQGGVPTDLAERSDLHPVFETALRADFALYAGYYHHRVEPLDVPITVLYGRDDTELTKGELLGWRRQTISRPELCELAAGHWLVDEDPAGVAACLAERILADVLVEPHHGRNDRNGENGGDPGHGR